MNWRRDWVAICLAISVATMCLSCGDKPPTSKGNDDILVATLTQDLAFSTSGLAPQDVQAICQLMVSGEVVEIEDDTKQIAAPYSGASHSVPTRLSDQRILSVTVEPGGDTVHIRTGEVRGPLAGSGDEITLVRNRGVWYKIEHSWWIS